MIRKRQCRAIARVLWDHAAGNLTEVERECVQSHLAVCSGCSELARQNQRTRDLLQSYTKQDVPTSRSSYTEVRRRIESGGESLVAAPARRRMIPGWAGAALSGAACAMLMFWVMGRGAIQPVGSTRPADSPSVAPTETADGRRAPVSPPRIDTGALTEIALDLLRPKSAEIVSAASKNAPDVHTPVVKLVWDTPHPLPGRRPTSPPAARFVSGNQADMPVRTQPERQYVIGTIPESGHASPASYASGDGPVW